MNAKEKYNYWLSRLADGDPLKEELLAIADDEKEIEERFYLDLTFGTAGLRGILAAGTNRMNYLTVGRATQGIANYIKTFGIEARKKGVVIAHDCRYKSREFCLLTARILAANGIKAYIFDDLRTTPELAFMVRNLGTISGINITASHNPQEYNGYKAYWQDGCQVSADVAEGMLKEIGKLDYFDGIQKMDYDDAVIAGLIEVLDESKDREYLDLVESCKVHEGDELALDLPVVYTPLNGAGAIPFAVMMKDRGFTNWHIVEEQRLPDPEFTTVGYPNPEDPKAFKLAEELGRKVGAEVLMATDPDGDRFAIELRDENGDYVPLNGNQTGYLLVNYLLEGHKDAGTLPENGAMVKSIVTSNLSEIMANAYGVKMFEALTGFKNICGRIPDLEKMGLKYMFGYEESIGYAACPEIRDKDGISAGMLVAEAAAYYKKQGKTLFQVLNEIYEKYGWVAEDEPNIVLKGIEGSKRIARMMDDLRAHPITEVNGRKVVKLIDYKDGYEDIPASNVLRYFLDNDAWFAIRPSGTEPKIKFYFYAMGKDREDAIAVNKAIKDEVFARVNSVD